MSLLVPIKIFVALSLVWAVIALTVQVLTAWGGGRRDYSKPAGSPARGLLYGFTGAMLPAHKETVRLHPAKFAVGLVLHVGVIVTLSGAVLLLIAPVIGGRLLAVVWPLLLVSLIAGLYLFVHRLRSPVLRTLSVPDDYLATLATCGWLALACVAAVGERGLLAFLVYTGVLLVYLPLGKLRHAVFFFVARGEYARRLGHRGVYPPSAASTE